MRTSLVAAAIVGISMLAPATASAAKSCLDQYYVCLNNTWDTSGLARIAADAECGIRYYSCLRAASK